MAEIGLRRSSRVALRLPIRVYAIDFKGVDFVEDSNTLVVNQHGAKIRLIHQLIPEQEIRIACRQTDRDAIFRVVSKAGEADGRHTFWGVECLAPNDNIWGVKFPPVGPQDRSSVRVMLQCPRCQSQELLFLSEPLLQAIEEMAGLQRGCRVCGSIGFWKQIPYSDA